MNIDMHHTEYVYSSLCLLSSLCEARSIVNKKLARGVSCDSKSCSSNVSRQNRMLWCFTVDRYFLQLLVSFRALFVRRSERIKKQLLFAYMLCKWVIMIVLRSVEHSTKAFWFVVPNKSRRCHRPLHRLVLDKAHTNTFCSFNMVRRLSPAGRR